MVADDLKQISLNKTCRRPTAAQADGAELPGQPDALPDARRLPVRHALGSDLAADGLQKMLLGQQTAAQVAGDIQKGLSQWFKP